MNYPLVCCFSQAELWLHSTTWVPTAASWSLGAWALTPEKAVMHTKGLHCDIAIKKSYAHRTITTYHCLCSQNSCWLQLRSWARPILLYHLRSRVTTPFSRGPWRSIFTQKSFHTKASLYSWEEVMVLPAAKTSVQAHKETWKIKEAHHH
jgi:hypothetical protein